MLRYRRLRARACWRQGTCLRPGIGTFFSLPPLLHSGPSGAPITPFEIDGATQVWHSSARYAQFRAPAFPSSLPCRSRCRALAGLVRARTSDDIRPRALGTLPPKSFAHSPLATAFYARVHFGGNSDLCATSSCARFGSALYGGLGSHHPFGSSPLAPPASRPACRVEGFQNLHQHLRRGDRAERARNHSGLAQLFGRCRRGGGNFCRALLSTPRLLSQRSLCLRC